MPLQRPARLGSSVHKTLTALRVDECTAQDLVDAGVGKRRRVENVLSELHVAGHVQKRTVYGLTASGVALLEKIESWKPYVQSTKGKNRKRAILLPDVALVDEPAFVAPDPEAVRSLAQALEGWRVG